MQNEWFFVDDPYEGPIPSTIHFITSKSNDWIKENFGGDKNGYFDPSGRGFLSIAYRDLYTENDQLGGYASDSQLNYSVFETNDKELTKLNFSDVQTVDLDKAFAQEPKNDDNYSCYEEVIKLMKV